MRFSFCRSAAIRFGETGLRFRRVLKCRGGGVQSIGVFVGFVFAQRKIAEGIFDRRRRPITRWNLEPAERSGSRTGQLRAIANGNSRCPRPATAFRMRQLPIQFVLLFVSSLATHGLSIHSDCRGRRSAQNGPPVVPNRSMRFGNMWSFFNMKAAERTAQRIQVLTAGRVNRIRQGEGLGGRSVTGGRASRKDAKTQRRKDAKYAGRLLIAPSHLRHVLIFVWRCCYLMPSRHCRLTPLPLETIAT